MSRSAEQILARIKQIPTFPENIQAIVTAIDSADSSATEIAEFIGQDPAIASNLLRLANSVFYGFLGRVTTIREAVVLIGLREVKNLVLATAVLRSFSPSSSAGFDRKALWRHSVTTSFLTKMLAREAFLVDQEGAIMVGGLLHDVGKIVIDQYFTEEFTQVLRIVDNDGLTFSQAEKQILGYTHYQIGATLLKRWNFPPELSFPVFYHHAPWLDARFTAYSATVYMANVMAKELGYAAYDREQKREISLYGNAMHREFFEKLGFPSTKQEIDTFLRIAEARLTMESADLFAVFAVAA